MLTSVIQLERRYSILGPTQAKTVGLTIGGHHLSEPASTPLREVRALIFFHFKHCFNGFEKKKKNTQCFYCSNCYHLS